MLNCVSLLCLFVVVDFTFTQVFVDKKWFFKVIHFCSSFASHVWLVGLKLRYEESPGPPVWVLSALLQGDFRVNLVEIIRDRDTVLFPITRWLLIHTHHAVHVKRVHRIVVVDR